MFVVRDLLDIASSLFQPSKLPPDDSAVERPDRHIISAALRGAVAGALIGSLIGAVLGSYWLGLLLAVVGAVVGYRILGTVSAGRYRQPED